MTSKKISEFIQETSFQQTDLLNIVRSSTNFGIPFSALAPALGVTGSINVVGGTGIAVLEQPSATINNIRTIESGNGILASLSPQNGVSLAQNITVDQTGVPVIVDKLVAAPIYRSFVAGAGATVALSGNTVIFGVASASGTNVVIVNQLSDFPTPIGDVITLVDNTNYIISSAVSTSNRFILGNNNLITANNLFSPILTSTTSGSMFTGVDKNFIISDISIDCPNGKVFDLSSPSFPNGNEFFIENLTILNCASVGTFNNLRTVDVDNFLAGNATQGINIIGAQWSFFAFDKTVFLSTSNTFIGFDFGVSVHDKVEINRTTITAPAGAIGIKGAASSANISPNKIASVITGDYGGGLTPLSGITSNDIRWEFIGNAGIPDSVCDALMAFNGNSAETIISFINTPVKVIAAWVVESSNRFTLTTDGRATYNGERDLSIPIDVAIDLKSASGGSINVSAYIALNGSVIAASKTPMVVSSSTIAFANIPWQLSTSQNDFIEVYVENNSGTINLIAGHAVMRID